MNREILEKKPPAMNVEDQFIWGFKTTVGPRTGNEWMKEMDLTGYGMWYTYHRIKPAHTRLSAFGDEILTHTILGTDKDDFGVLKAVTGKDFHKRSEMGSAFKERSNQTPQLWSPVPFNFVCKMVTANTASQMANRMEQLCSIPVLGGYRVRHEKTEFAAYLAKASTRGVTPTMVGPNVLIQMLNDAVTADRGAFEKSPVRGKNDWHLKDETSLSYKKKKEDKDLTPLANIKIKETRNFSH